MVKVSEPYTTVTDEIVRIITKRVDMVFGLIGNGNVALISGLTSQGFNFTGVRHEATAVTAADAYYRATGKTAVATATYGPGFTNMTTGLAEAQLARIPMVVVVGDAPSTGRRPFDIDQQTVTGGLNIPCVKITPENVTNAMVCAFEMAEDCQEPVVALVPYDIGSQRAIGQSTHEAYDPIVRPVAAEEELVDIARALATAKRPLILTGGGVVRTGTGQLVRQLGDAVGAVFMHSLTASHVTGEEHSLGIAGGFTPEHKLPAVRAADMVLILGATSNAFQTRKGTLFATENIYRIDLSDRWNLDLTTARTVFADLADALPRLLRAIQALRPRPSSYREELPGLFAPDTLDQEPVYDADNRLNPRHVAARLNQILPADRQVVLDGGHYIAWIGERFHISSPASLIAVGTAFQSIGLGLGSAVGASVGSPEQFSVCISGDGGGQMALADLSTFIKQADRGAVIIFNDVAYGAELHQYAVQGADPSAMYLPYLDFAALGLAMGAIGINVNTMEDLDVFAKWLDSGADGVVVVNIRISTQFVHPVMRPGATG